MKKIKIIIESIDNSLHFYVIGYILGMREEMQKKKDTEMGKNDSNIEESAENVKGDSESNNDGKQEQSNDVSADKNGMY